MAQPTANLLGALKEGWLTKCGDKHQSWKTRWFVLTKDVLYYFKHETATEPLGVIPLKDYQKCKGMDGNAYAITRKENSFFLQTPYRTFKIYAVDWRTSENWAESITNIGDFLRKREETRNPSPYQSGVMKNTADVINFGSSLIHWFKLVVDTTPSYKTGIKSIYDAAIYDTPKALGTEIILLARAAINALSAPRNPACYDRLKQQVQKVEAQVDRAVAFITCCSEMHKGSFQSDLAVIRGAIQQLKSLSPSFPADEIGSSAVQLSKTCCTLCQPYVTSDLRDSVEADSSGQASVAVLGTLLRELSRSIDSNLNLFKNRPQLPGEQSYISLLQSNYTKVDSATNSLIKVLTQIDARKPADINLVEALYMDITKTCKEIVSVAHKLFAESNFAE